MVGREIQSVIEGGGEEIKMEKKREKMEGKERCQHNACKLEIVRIIKHAHTHTHHTL